MMSDCEDPEVLDGKLLDRLNFEVLYEAFGQMKQDELENQEYGAEAPDLNFRETMA